MQLFGTSTSPFARHCRIALLETGFDCEFVETDFSASAKQTPTKKVPFFKTDDLSLTDSSSILKYLREKSGSPFLEDVKAYDQYCLVNTLLDTAINVFLLENDGVTGSDSTYIQRQQQRIQSGLKALNQLSLDEPLAQNDAGIRLACFLDWGRFRNRIDLTDYEPLAQFLANARSYQHFADTALDAQ